jgi:hypothetical protein
MTGIMNSSKGMSFLQAERVGNPSEKTRKIPDKPE